MLFLAVLLFACGGGNIDKDSSLSILCTPTTIVVNSSKPIFYWDRGCWSNEVLCLESNYWKDFWQYCGLDNGTSVFVLKDGRCFFWGGTCGELDAPPLQDPNLYTWWTTDNDDARAACRTFFDAYLNGKKDTYPECE